MLQKFDRLIRLVLKESSIFSLMFFLRYIFFKPFALYILFFLVLIQDKNLLRYFCWKFAFHCEETTFPEPLNPKILKIELSMRLNFILYKDSKFPAKCSLERLDISKPKNEIVQKPMTYSEVHK